MRRSACILVSILTVALAAPVSARFGPAVKLFKKGLYGSRIDPVVLQPGQCDCAGLLCGPGDFALRCNGRLLKPTAERTWEHKGRLTGTVVFQEDNGDFGCEICGCSDEVADSIELSGSVTCLDSN